MRALAACALLALVASCASGKAAINDGFGTFIGKVVAEWLESDGRTMKLREPFAYIGPDGTRWDAPTGSVVDGASIPRWAWSLIGGPFEGRYRDASVIHDVACVQKLRPWQQVHRAFYTGMRANGVGEKKAKTMYAAVYKFGPRWSRTTQAVIPKGGTEAQVSILSASELPGETVKVDVHPYYSPVFSGDAKVRVTATYTPKKSALQEADFPELQKEIEAKNLTLEQIENYEPGRSP